MFEVSLQNGMKRFEVAPDEAILTAALRAGIHLQHICRRGTCGSCRAKIEHGSVRQDLFRPAALSHRDAQAGRVLLCCSRALSDIVIDANEMDRPMAQPRRMPARVTALRRVTHDVAIVTLRIPPVEELDYQPGQYIGIVGPDGATRSFSIANAKRPDRTIDLHVGRVANGAVTGLIHDSLSVGDLLRIESPQGSASLPPEGDRPVVAIVGGTGYAPLHAILEDWVASGAKRSIHVYWGSRTPAGFYALPEARALIMQLPFATLTTVVSDEAPGDGWQGRRGLVHHAALADHRDLTAIEVFVCGSPGLVDAAERDCLARGLNPEHFQADTFYVGQSLEQA
jgi:CDP-4-dehydro-6-deoxyglucose reductase